MESIKYCVYKLVTPFSFALESLAIKSLYRIDLTAEKRYSLSGPTKTLLNQLDEPVRIQVLLKGDFPAGFKKLANSVEEFLLEAKEYGKGNLQIVFVDPFKMAGD